jgi:hypothetical protein
MDALVEFLEDVKQSPAVRGNFVGLLHVLIGRRLQKADGTPVSAGVTWRTVAGFLKRVRWDKEAVRELGLDPRDLPQRDRERYWYIAIVHAGVDSLKAIEAGDRLAEKLRPRGYVVGPAPGQAR